MRIDDDAIQIQFLDGTLHLVGGPRRVLRRDGRKSRVSPGMLINCICQAIVCDRGDGRCSIRVQHLHAGGCQ
jgi:hypothetical protein